MTRRTRPLLQITDVKMSVSPARVALGSLELLETEIQPTQRYNYRYLSQKKKVGVVESHSLWDVFKFANADS
jgi:hypothetical protein